jgi:hypothetical protein
MFEIRPKGLKTLIVLTPVAVLGQRGGCVQIRLAVTHHDELVRFGEGQGVQDRVKDTENRCGRTDTDRQSGDGEYRKAPFPGKCSKRVAEVVHKISKHNPAPFLSNQIFHLPVSTPYVFADRPIGQTELPCQDVPGRYLRPRHLRRFLLRHSPATEFPVEILQLLCELFFYLRSPLGIDPEGGKMIPNILEPFLL